MRFSTLIPARNEEKLLPGCLESIKVAAEPFPDQLEVIVAVNRCTDRTEEMALAHGAKVVYDGSRNLAKIRNAAARVATGKWYLIRNPRFVWRIFTGKSQKDADHFYYDVRR